MQMRTIDREYTGKYRQIPASTGIKFYFFLWRLIKDDRQKGSGALTSHAVRNLKHIRFGSATGLFCLCLGLSCPGVVSALPSLEEAMAAPTDLWGELAMKQPDGPSYDFFASLLPPLRYVNADFHYYPIVLSAPNATVKAVLVANGSGVNLRGGVRAWNDNGVPVRFRVGPDEFLFGGVPERVSEPALADGWLPIVEIRYLHPTSLQQGGNVPLDAPVPDATPEIYRLEAFAATEPELAADGVVFVKFDLVQGTNGTVTVESDPVVAALSDESLTPDRSGPIPAAFDSAWKPDHRRYRAKPKPGTSATLAIYTKAGARPVECSPAAYAEHRAACVETWQKVLAGGMNVETPEPYVNNAWRHLVCQNFELIKANSIHYSFGNQYDKLYESEGSDAALAMLNWGYESDMRRLMVPLFDFTRKDLECHQAAFKLIDLCRYYWQTRDTTAVRELRPRWEKEAALLIDTRTNEFGLCPKNQYCGDISTMVYSLIVNAKGWRALSDFSAVLAETGEADESRRLAESAASLRRAVFAALDKGVDHSIDPPFVPVALYTNEPVHNPITATRIGNYWNIIIGYVISSGIFPPGSQEESWIPHYQEQHGGLCMGMLRASGGYTFWPSAFRYNPLYGTRYALDTLRRDDPERALVSFYGMLAQGLTRNTFVGGEGCSLTPSDERGRLLYCPPNSAANGHLLSMLRNLLVQDWDMDGDGKPETLRLLFATPKRWLEDGKTINVERAPTAFGPVSVRAESHLSQGEIVVNVSLPDRNPAKQTLLRVRVPDGWRVTSAQIGPQALKTDATGTVDLSNLKGALTIHFSVSKS
jgi:hypothetical protein